MKIKIHPSEERGRSELGWLHSRFSFSFAEFYDPEKMGFGALRVLNDDEIEPGGGFGMHPHDNMEIVTILLEGALEHKDSMGNHGVISAGEVQRMSAGTGIVHSEFNHSKENKVHLLQIWVQPKERGIAPSYEQKKLTPADMRNKLALIVSGPKGKGRVTFHQDASFFMGNFDPETEVFFKTTKPDLGQYLFVIKGSIDVAGKTLQERDAASITQSDMVTITAVKESQILIIEVPMLRPE